VYVHSLHQLFSPTDYTLLTPCRSYHVLLWTAEITGIVKSFVERNIPNFNTDAERSGSDASLFFSFCHAQALQPSSPSTTSVQQETQAASCRPFSYHKIHMMCSILCAVPAVIRSGARIAIGSCQPEECEEVTERVPPGVKSTKIAAHSRWGVTCGRWLPQNCSRPMLTLGGRGWRWLRCCTRGLYYAGIGQGVC
jgi:hypothetical protein